MPQNPQIIFQQAIAEYNQNNNETVIKLLRPLLKKQPQNVDVLNLSASALARSGKHKDAIKQCKLALKLVSKSARAHQTLGDVYRDQSLFVLAYEHYEKAFKLEPSNPRPLMEITLSLQEQEKWQEAETYVDRFLQAGGDPLEGNIRKAVCRYSLYDYDQAIALLEIAEKIRPGLDIVQYYRAMVFDKTDRKPQAEELYLDLINNRRHSPSLFSLSLLYFSIGEWQKAFSLYDSRPVAHNLSIYCQQEGVPIWDGESSFAGKHVFVRGEQGLGDQIRYLYFLPFLLEDASKVSLFCDSRLYPLIKSTYPDIHCVPAVTFSSKLLKHVSADVSVCIGSLGKCYGSALPDRQASGGMSREQAGFVHASETEITQLAEYLPKNGKPNVGVSWRSIRFMKERNDWYLSAEQLAKLFKGADVNVISLQYDVIDEEYQAFRDAGVELHVIPDLNLKDDQAGVAALMASLDAVVSVSTALYELAGAVGVSSLIFAVENIRWFMSEAHIKGFYPNTQAVYKTMFTEWDQALCEAQDFIKVVQQNAEKAT